MSGLRPSYSLAATVLRLTRLHISVAPKIPVLPVSSVNYFKSLKCTAAFHSSATCRSLSEFFDDEKNFGEREVKVGRGWKIDELRIKSNEDLHKLWFVLLKERNMLLTMEHDAKEEYRLFPNPERIDKVEDSMKNLEEVVRERNNAYWQLEIGESAERPSGVETDPLGRTFVKKYIEHFVPKFMHSSYSEKGHKGDMINFQRLMREKKFLEKRRYLRRIRNHVSALWKYYPDMDVEAAQKQFPEVDVKKLKYEKKARGHHDKNQH